MSKINCLVPTPAMKELADKFKNIVPTKIYTDIELWQQKYNKDIDTYPTKEELEKFINELSSTRIQEDLSNYSIKPGVPELFESDSELANKVYEALGFGKDVEAKKAEIERRRREKLKSDSGKIADKVEIFEYQDEEVGTVRLQVRYFRNGKKQIFTNISGHFSATSDQFDISVENKKIFPAFEEAIKVGEQTGEEYYKNLKDNLGKDKLTLEEKINAKYDAELKALESPEIQEKETNVEQSDKEAKIADIERSLGITLTDKEKEVLDYLSGQKNQMKDFYDNKGLLTTLGRKLNSIVEQTGKKLAEAVSKKLGFKVEDVRVPNNLGGLDVIKQYQTKDSKPIGDYEQLVYNYLNAEYDAELAALDQITPEQKQEAQQLYSQYLDTKNEPISEYKAKQDLEGFKNFTKSSIENSNANKQSLSVDNVMSPEIRHDRVNLISRLFSNEVSLLLKQKEEELKQAIDKAISVNNIGLSQDLNNELTNLNRFSIIKLYTPAEIFNNIKSKYFDSFLEGSDSDRIKTIIDTLNTNENYDEYTNDEKLDIAKVQAEYRKKEYQKVSDYFKELAEEAAINLVSSEGLKIDLYSMEPSDITLDSVAEFNEYDETVSIELSQEDKEESPKEHWMSNFRQISAHDSLSQDVRRTLSNIVKLDYEGYAEEDDLGNVKYLRENVAYITLINSISKITKSSEFMPQLEKLAKDNIWVNQIIDLLKSNEQLYTQFYTNFRKDYTEYWVQSKTLMPDGTYKIKTIASNKGGMNSSLLSLWRTNNETGTVFSKHSIYDSSSNLNIDNAKYNLNKIIKYINDFNNMDNDSLLKELNKNEVIKDILDLFNSVGININKEQLIDSFFKVPEIEGFTIIPPIKSILSQLYIIFNKVSNGSIKSTDNNKVDLLQEFSSIYDSIANYISSKSEDVAEPSAREGGKSWYSFTVPNYLNKVVKKLSNFNNDINSFKDFLQKEYKNYSWFYKNGKWRNDILKNIEESEEVRKNFKYKVVLTHDKIDYTKWDSLDYAVVMLTEYSSEESIKGKTNNFAYYHVPIYSDSPEAGFIKALKYTDNTILGDDGKFISYKDIIIDKMLDLVSQEYERIMQVIAEDNDYQNNPDSRIKPIQYFNIKRDKNGKIIDIGGAEFKFLPMLNTVKFKDGKSFLTKLIDIKKSGSSIETINFVKNTLYHIMDNDFEDFYTNMYNIGVVDEASNGSCLYIPYTGPKNNNKNILETLKEIKDILGEKWNSDMENVLKKYILDIPVRDKEAQDLFNIIKELLPDNKITKSLTLQNKAKEFLREYYYNSTFATSQIIQIFTTDLAYYGNMTNFQKRFKEVHSPAQKLNIEATYKGVRASKTGIERTIYLKDEEVVSHQYDIIKEVLQDKVNKNLISSIDKDIILTKFKNVNVADAQAYRSLDSYRAVSIMSGQWSNDEENAFNNIKNNTWDIRDFNILFQTIKPFTFTQVSKNSVNGFPDKKVPIQHKNSEFLLLALYNSIGGPINKSDKLRAINDIMQQYDIDVVQFESTTKVGKQGVIDINNITSYNDVKNIIINNIIKNGIEDENVIHSIPYEDYGIQTATPPHYMDEEQLLGVQIGRLGISDITDGTILELEDYKKSLSKEEFIKLYNNIRAENVLESFLEMKKIFDSKEEISRVLQDEVRSNPRFGNELIKACQLDSNGEFRVPLYDNVQTQRTQSLTHALIKNKIVKQKIKGGSLIQVSDYGLTDKLNIVFKDDKGNIIENRSKFKTNEEYENYLKTHSNISIKHIEVYMPAYSKKFFEPLMKEGTYELNYDDLPEELKKGIGYRIPTEDKYSMVPFYIKGFLPAQNGSCIMLPDEITVLSGSDFDVDKLYVILPEFTTSKKITYNKKAFINDFLDKLNYKGTNKEKQELINNILSIIDNEDAPSYNEGSNEYNIYQTWLNSKDKYSRVDTKFEKIKYDFNKPIHENSIQQRNNLIMDMYYSVLTNSDTAHKILNPGGFDNLKKTSRIIKILKNYSEKDLINKLETKDYLDKLSKLSIDELDTLISNNIQLNPLSPYTQLYFHKQNMGGGKLIGIYANHNSNHAILQNTEVSIKPDSSFVLNNKKYNSLHSIRNIENQYISKNNAEFLAASVDNVKDPVLSDLNQNDFTSNVSMLLSKLGYTSIEIGLLMTQPIIEEITYNVSKGNRQGKSQFASIKEVIKRYEEAAKYNEPNNGYNIIKDKSFTIKELAENIILQKDIEDINNTNDFRIKSYYKNQVLIGYLFNTILKSSDCLKDLVSITRVDSQNGNVDSSIEGTIIKLQKVKDFVNNINEYSLTGIELLDNLLSYTTEEDIRKSLYDSKLPFIQSYYTLGLKETPKLMKKLFMQYTDNIDDMLYVLKQYSKTEKLSKKTLGKIYKDIITYALSKSNTFGEDISKFSREKRLYYIQDFPKQLQAIKDSNSEISKLGLIENLAVYNKNEKNPFDTINLSIKGNMSQILKEKYSRDWASLLYMGEEGNKLAKDLFLYCYYKNGLQFGPNTFIQLCPVIVRENIDNYISSLRDMIDNQDDYMDFIEQFIYNNLNNGELVSKIDSNKSTINFTNNKIINDEIEIQIDSNSIYEDKKIIKKTEKLEDGIEYNTFQEFISTRIFNDNVYYRLETQDNNTAYYKRIYPLCNEYEYGKNVTEIESIYPKSSIIDDINNIPFDDFYDIEDNNEFFIPFSEEDILNEAINTVMDKNIQLKNDTSVLSFSRKPKLDDTGNPIC